ncbi:MAG: carotenoid biosynthesis protein [Acidobacteria bacterium]|nr:carotenoid biosynthesis protein [Acidobacteriota bacterium]
MVSRKIYYYPDGGSYFGITLANFFGWFFVCFAIIRLFILLERVIFKRSNSTDRGIMQYPYKAIGPVGLLSGVLGFNLFMTFWIGERMLGVVGVIITLPVILLVLLGLLKGRLLKIEA